jgi:hypothetical protein
MLKLTYSKEYGVDVAGAKSKLRIDLRQYWLLINRHNCGRIYSKSDLLSSLMILSSLQITSAKPRRALDTVYIDSHPHQLNMYLTVMFSYTGIKLPCTGCLVKRGFEPASMWCIIFNWFN